MVHNLTIGWMETELRHNENTVKRIYSTDFFLGGELVKWTSLDEKSNNLNLIGSQKKFVE